MARPRTFDSEKVLSSVMALFRQKGYESTSVRDLESATGLKAPSLYNAFGNKGALFAAALAHYRTAVLRRRIDAHLHPERGLDGIRAFFTSTYATEPDPTHGCLLTNTAIEFDHVDTVARDHVQTGLGEIRSAIAAQLEHCRRHGEASDRLDIDAAAQTLLVLYEGLLVLIRTRTPAVDLDTVVDTALAAIAGNPSTRRQGGTT